MKGICVCIIGRELRRNPGQTSKSIFAAVGRPEVSKATRNEILRTVASVRAPTNMPLLTPKYKTLRMEWARKYLQVDMSRVLFTDETQATLDGPDGWANGWVYFGDEGHRRLRRQQGGGGMMIWAGIIGDNLVGPIRVPEGVKVTSASYCDLLSKSFVPWMDEISLALLRDFIFMHDNAPSHSVRATREFLTTLGIQGEKLIVWPAASPDLNPIENYWSIIKRHVYANGRQYTSKGALWEAIIDAAMAVPPETINKFTASMSSRLFEVIRTNSSHMKKY